MTPETLPRTSLSRISSIKYLSLILRTRTNISDLSYEVCPDNKLSVVSFQFGLHVNVINKFISSCILYAIITN